MPLRILISHFLEQLLILFFFSLAYFNASLQEKITKTKLKICFRIMTQKMLLFFLSSRMDTILIIESAEREIILEKQNRKYRRGLFLSVCHCQIP